MRAWDSSSTAGGWQRCRWFPTASLRAAVAYAWNNLNRKKKQWRPHELTSWLIYMCPPTTICMSSYCYSCVLILPYDCPHTALYVSSYCYMSLCYWRADELTSSLLYMCPDTTIYVSSYYHICVLILLCMCPHATPCVCILLSMCPHTTIYVSSFYWWADELTSIYVSSYCYVCVLILQYICPHY